MTISKLIDLRLYQKMKWNVMFSMKKKLKEAWDYYLYHPDKTEVIIQSYFLNPLYKKIEWVIFGCIALSRRFINVLPFKKKDKVV